MSGRAWSGLRGLSLDCPPQMIVKLVSCDLTNMYKSLTLGHFHHWFTWFVAVLIPSQTLDCKHTPPGCETNTPAQRGWPSNSKPMPCSPHTVLLQVVFLPGIDDLVNAKSIKDTATQLLMRLLLMIHSLHQDIKQFIKLTVFTHCKTTSQVTTPVHSQITNSVFPYFRMCRVSKTWRSVCGRWTVQKSTRKSRLQRKGDKVRTRCDKI